MTSDDFPESSTQEKVKLSWTNMNNNLLKLLEAKNLEKTKKLCVIKANLAVGVVAFTRIQHCEIGTSLRDRSWIRLYFFGYVPRPYAIAGGPKHSLILKRYV